MAVELRQAGIADTDSIRACVQHAYAKYQGRLPCPPKPVLADYAAVVSRGTTWLVEDEGRCVGVLVLVPKPDQMLLENVAVEPVDQGRGVGRLLLQFAEAEARSRGLPEVSLYTHALMTENIGLYSRHGYVQSDRREIDGRDTVFMTKSLRQ